MNNPTAKIRMQNQKEITIELFPEFAPNTVN
jgi:cyclophilin family peptidyl-prolyl cis-trans isomerase